MAAVEHDTEAITADRVVGTGRIGVRTAVERETPVGRQARGVMDTDGECADATPELAGALAELAAELAAAVARQYRIEAEDARQVIEALWTADLALRGQAESLPDPRRLERTAAYRAAAKRARRKIYYDLRRYVQRAAELATAVDALVELCAQGATLADARVLELRDRIVALHVSTRERLPDADALFAAITSLAGAPRSIVDVGCGVEPLLHAAPPHDAGLEEYLALDRDPDAIRAVAAWGALRGDRLLSARVAELSDGLAGVRPRTGEGRFDLALALKVVPVVARQAPHLLRALAEVPARRLLITGSREAMSRHRSIERREAHVLRRFAAEHGFAIAGELRTASETGLLLERVE